MGHGNASILCPNRKAGSLRRPKWSLRVFDAHTLTQTYWHLGNPYGTRLFAVFMQVFGTELYFNARYFFSLHKKSGHTITNVPADCIGLLRSILKQQFSMRCLFPMLISKTSWLVTSTVHLQKWCPQYTSTHCHSE